MVSMVNNDGGLTGPGWAQGLSALPPLVHSSEVGPMTRSSSLSLAAIAAQEGVRDPRILEAMREVARELFVPPEFQDDAGSDAPIPIGFDQTTSQPSLIATMLDSVAPQAGDAALEVGTGYGYQAALLARLVSFVWSVERLPALAAAARANLAAAGVANVEVVTGDGTLGLPRNAPFDVIVVSAAFPSVPQPLADQLADGGRLVQPVGPSGAEDVNLYVKRDGQLTLERLVSYACFVPLLGEHGYH